jgi:sporulation protein YlmC with PRC-barrel domain
MEQPMIRHLAVALLAGAVFTATASAQTSSGTAARDNSAATHKEGQWRASKLAGVNVYNDNNEKIGDISDVIIDRSGKVDTVVLGVGGFLGVGEHYVAVPMEKLKWVNEPVRGSAVSSAPADRPTVGTNNAGAATGEINRFNHPQGAVRETNWYPDHAVLNATKDQLKAMPQFKY